MRLRRPRPTRQQGFGLLAFVLATSVFAFSFVFGYMSLWTKERQLNDNANKDRYIKEAVERLEAVHPTLSLRMDSSLGNSISGEDLMDYAQITRQWKLRLEKTNLLFTPEGYGYRAYAFWLDIPDEGSAPPNLSQFISTGVMTCGAATDPCDPSYHMLTWNSAEQVRSMMRETETRVELVAKKAQLYFKARQMQDPERNVSVNYFYKPSNVCDIPNSLDLGCMEEYTMLATISGSGGSMTGTATKIEVSPLAEKLGLAPHEVVTAWNIPLEVSNVKDSVKDKPPFTLAIRAVLPGGTQYIKKSAVQQF